MGTRRSSTPFCCNWRIKRSPHDFTSRSVQGKNAAKRSPSPRNAFRSPLRKVGACQVRIRKVYRVHDGGILDGILTSEGFLDDRSRPDRQQVGSVSKVLSSFVSLLQ